MLAGEEGILLYRTPRVIERSRAFSKAGLARILLLRAAEGGDLMDVEELEEEALVLARQVG